MDLAHFDLNGIVSLANKIAPGMAYLNGPIMISVVAMSLEDAFKVSRAVEARADSRYFFESFDYQTANKRELVRGRTRAMVIITDKIALGSDVIASFKMSLLAMTASCCTYVGEPDFRPISDDFIVDIEGNPFFKRRKK